MTTTSTHTNRSAGKFGGLLFTPQAGYPEAPRHRGLFSTFAAWRQRRRAAAELQRLSDRELADIGLTRQGIAEAVQGK